MLVVIFLILLISAEAFAFAPTELARRVSESSSCLISTLFRSALAFTPPAIIVILFYKFIQIERKRETGEVYADELYSLLFTGIILSLIFRLVYLTYEFFGVPVSYLVNQILTPPTLENQPLLATFTIPSCADTPFGRYLPFFLTIVVSVSRMAIVVVPVFALFVSFFKIVQKHYSSYKKENESLPSIGLKTMMDLLVLLIIVMTYTYLVYQILYIDYVRLVRWFFAPDTLS